MIYFILCFLRAHFLNIQCRRFTLKCVINLQSLRSNLLPPFSGLEFLLTLTLKRVTHTLNMEATIPSETQISVQHIVPYPRRRYFHMETVPDSSRLNVSHVHPKNLIKGGVVSATLSVQVCLYCERLSFRTRGSGRDD